MNNKSVQELISQLGYTKVTTQRRAPEEHERFDDNPHYNFFDSGNSVRSSAYKELLLRGISIADELCQALDDRKSKYIGPSIAALLVEMGTSVIPYVQKYTTDSDIWRAARANWILCELGNVEAYLRFLSHNVNSGLQVNHHSKMTIENADLIEKWMTENLNIINRSHVDALFTREKEERYKAILIKLILLIAEDKNHGGKDTLEKWGLLERFGKPNWKFNQLVSSLPTEALIKLQVGQDEIVSRKNAVKYLIDALNSKSTGEFAVNTLQKMNYSPETDSDGLLYYFASGNFDACLQYGSTALEKLVGELEEGSIRPGLPKALSKSGKPMAIEALIKRLEKGEWHSELPDALSNLENPRVLDAAIIRLQNGWQDPELVKLIASFNDPKALQAMIDRHIYEVETQPYRLSRSLVEMLGKSKDPKVIDILIQSYVLIKKKYGKTSTAFIGAALREAEDRPRSVLDIVLGRREWASKVR